MITIIEPNAHQVKDDMAVCIVIMRTVGGRMSDGNIETSATMTYPTGLDGEALSQ